jgi:uncharacterized protein YidB (DUF937 family)
MSILDTLKSVGKNVGGTESSMAAATGLLQALGGTSGIGGLIQTFQNNGRGDLVEKFAGGQTGAMEPNALQQALGNSGLVDRISQSTGISANGIKSKLAVLVPVLLNYVLSNGLFTTKGNSTGKTLPDAGSLVQAIAGQLIK